MGIFRFRIGAKLGLSAGIGVTLVGAMVVAQQLSDSSVTKASLAAHNQSAIRKDLNSARAMILTAQNARRDMLLAEHTEDADKALARMAQAGKDGQKLLDDAAQRMVSLPNRERAQKLKAAFSTYLAAVNEQADAHKSILAVQRKQYESAANWNKAYEAIAGSPLLAQAQNRQQIDTLLREAQSLMKDSRIGFWRFNGSARKEIRRRGGAGGRQIREGPQAHSRARERQADPCGDRPATNGAGAASGQHREHPEKHRTQAAARARSHRAGTGPDGRVDRRRTRSGGTSVGGRRGGSR